MCARGQHKLMRLPMSATPKGVISVQTQCFWGRKKARRERNAMPYTRVLNGIVSNLYPEGLVQLGLHLFTPGLAGDGGLENYHPVASCGLACVNIVPIMGCREWNLNSNNRAKREVDPIMNRLCYNNTYMVLISQIREMVRQVCCMWVPFVCGCHQSISKDLAVYTFSWGALSLLSRQVKITSFSRNLKRLREQTGLCKITSHQWNAWNRKMSQSHGTSV